MKRVSLFCGHYGSGKTNVAVNYAVFLHEKGLSTVIADLDTVNPYFRTKDSEEELCAMGIDVISLPFANTNIDLPSLPSKAYSIVQNREKYAVLDVGGDDAGAYALGRFAPAIKEENDYDCFYVVNFCRPLSDNAQSAFEVMKEIEAASSIPFTGIINNTNLGEETTPETLEKSAKKAEELSELCGLPLCFTTVKLDIADKVNCPKVFPITLQKNIGKNRNGGYYGKGYV